MRIVIFEPTFLIPKPYAGSYLVLLNNQVKGLSSLGHEVFILAEVERGKKQPFKILDNCWIYPLNGKLSILNKLFTSNKKVASYFCGFSSPDNIVNAIRIIKKELRPDIIYSCGTSFAAVFSSLLNYFTGVPNVHYVFEYTGKWKWWRGDRDIFPEYRLPRTYLIEQFVNTLIREIPRREAFQQWGLNRAKKIITSSGYTKNLLVKRGIKEKKISIVLPVVEYPGILIQAVNNNSVAYFGHFFQARGILDLLNAFSGVVQAIPDAKLKIALTNLHPLTKFYFDNRVKKLSLYSHIQIMGVLSDVYAELLSESTLVCLPYRDTPSMKLLEAMAYGKPVITTDVGWIPEFFHDEEHLFIVPKGNIKILEQKIKRVLSDKLLLNKISNNARERIKEKFDIQKNTVQITRILEEVVNG